MIFCSLILYYFREKENSESFDQALKFLIFFLVNEVEPLVDSFCRNAKATTNDFYCVV